MTLAELNRSITSQLSVPLGGREARSVARLVMEDIVGTSQVDIFARGERSLEAETVELVESIVQRIIDGEPAQYAIGRATFMGMELKVSPATLIPRPETEGLVDMIIDEHKSHHDLNILDIGTGSGCIAIALARALPFAHIDACDVSEEALAVAAENAQNLRTKVSTFRLDILSAQPEAEFYDIIVSNPPYIAEFERKDMDSRVVDHEPHTALFVPDSEPLLFYKAIADYAKVALKPGASLYFEINPLFANELKEMIQSRGFTDIQILRDYIGKNRFAKAKHR